MHTNVSDMQLSIKFHADPQNTQISLDNADNFNQQRAIIFVRSVWQLK